MQATPFLIALIIVSSGSLSVAISGSGASFQLQPSTDAQQHEQGGQDDELAVPLHLGCTDKAATDYDERAQKDDGSCHHAVRGCTDAWATNYNATATLMDGSCEYVSTYGRYVGVLVQMMQRVWKQLHG
ncbi:unnamed protein product [Vitrella brassicaformis CCMP3155]|uniref:Uncharacterized protein n=2 Tax=Vitrella brassicaformis TaxID=1169539 RepID=A0A0G4H7L3_VITBC|nr:unnamed protein product [Vitrella brassicaformis CCMP3155]|eukprot:CEM39658.1 unnamed protein product [Vitrella brassicaformis CCMP3155]